MALFTTAPKEITVAPGTGSSYTIGGGTPPYTATSSNTDLATATASGTTLAVRSIAAGTTTIAVIDSAGNTVTIDLNSSGNFGTPVPLFTSAPTAITLTSGGRVTYTVGGGQAPYTATSGNPGVVTATLNGTTLTLNGISQGDISAKPTSIAVVDSAGKRVTIDVTVLARGQTGAPPTIFPASITAGDCTTNIPFVFTGGTPPFTVISSEPFNVPVSAPLPFGPDSYFLTSIDLLAVPRIEPALVTYPYKITLTVLDSQSRTATTEISVPSATICPKNSLLQIVSGSTSAHVSEKVTFQITGGVPPYTITSRNQTSASETIAATDATAELNSDDQKYYFNATALSTGGNPASLTGASLITVTSADGQNANIVLTVYP